MGFQAQNSQLFVFLAWQGGEKKSIQILSPPPQ